MRHVELGPIVMGMQKSVRTQNFSNFCASILEFLPSWPTKHLLCARDKLPRHPEIDPISGGGKSGAELI